MAIHGFGQQHVGMAGTGNALNLGKADDVKGKETGNVRGEVNTGEKPVKTNGVIRNSNGTYSPMGQLDDKDNGITILYKMNDDGTLSAIGVWDENAGEGIVDGQKTDKRPDWAE